MSQKRKHADTHDDTAANSKTFKKQRPFRPGNNHHKPKPFKRPNQSNDDDHVRSTNALKSRIRDLKRLLVHVENVEKHKMSAGARQERERELEAAEHELAEKLSASREAEYRKKMIGKYHQVRFFDRQKGTRIVKRLKKDLANLEDDSEKTALKKKIHNAEVDVNYAIYYPLMKPYSSLYPKSKSRGNDSAEDSEGNNNSGEVDGPKGDVEMWRAIEEAMEEGSLNTLRYSKDSVPAAPPQKKKKDKHVKKDNFETKSKSTSQKHNKHVEHAEEKDVGEESDGGFFE